MVNKFVKALGIVVPLVASRGSAGHGNSVELQYNTKHKKYKIYKYICLDFVAICLQHIYTIGYSIFNMNFIVHIEISE